MSSNIRPNGKNRGPSSATPFATLQVACFLQIAHISATCNFLHWKKSRMIPSLESNTICGKFGF